MEQRVSEMAAAILSMYLIVMNIIGIFVVLWDKYAARQGKWRTPERVFFFLTLLGGGAGTYAAMRVARHKTRHKRFMLGIPAVMLGELFLFIALFVKCREWF